MAADAFQFTRPRGARRRLQRHALAVVCFNSRAHGGRDRPSPTRGTGTSRFNSRAHGGRDRERLDGMSVGFVSIHAPTGGATRRAHTLWSRGVFQFTRPRGARLGCQQSHDVLLSFNSRAHGGRDSMYSYPSAAIPRFNSRAHGGRDRYGDVARLMRRVSIHAPTGGATWLVDCLRNIQGFNSRAHGGRDSRRASVSSATRFQFTRPRGARHICAR